MIDLTKNQKYIYDDISKDYPKADPLILIQASILKDRWDNAESWLAENGPVIEIRSDKGILLKIIKAPQLDVSKSSFESLSKLMSTIKSQQKRAD